MDRGRAALFPILDEIVAVKDKYKLLLCCGGGTRARHIYAMASDLELPTGVLAALGGYVPRQNARMLQMLLAKHGGLFIMHDDFEKLPLYFRLGCIPIMTGMPPFGYWEKPTAGGRIPQHRTDAGVFLSAEVLGVKRAIFIKDEDGALRGRSQEEPQAPRTSRASARASCSSSTCQISSSSASSSSTSRARASATSCRSSTGSSGAWSRARWRARMSGTIIFKD